MNLKSMVEVGGKVEIIVKRNPQEDIKGFSMVQDITSNEELVVTQPTLESQPVSLNPKEIVKVFFFKEDGKFYFRGQVTRELTIGNAIAISLKRISPIGRIQRRKFYRLKVVIPVYFTISQGEGKLEPKELKGYCHDISGSGLRLLTNYELVVGNVIKCSIYLDNEGPIFVSGRVVRVRLADKLNYKYDIGISFIDIPDTTQDLIVKFIFKKQRELRSKGFI